MEALKQCPFCGGKPKVLEINKGFAGFTGEVKDYIIKCAACRAQTATYHTIEHVRKAWNKRQGAEDESRTD